MAVPRKAPSRSAGLRLLDLLGSMAARTARTGNPWLSTQELAAATGIPLSSLYRYLRVLEVEGFVRSNGGRFRLGLRLLEFAGSILDSLDVRKEAEPVLQRLARDGGHTVHLAVLEGLEVVYIDRVEGSARYPIRSRIGVRYPAMTTAVGKVLLAYADETVQRQAAANLVKRTERSIVDPETFLAELTRARSAGYASDFEENEPGIRCVAAPVYDHAGRVVAAVSVTWPAALLGESAAAALTQELLAATAAVSAAMGAAAAAARAATRREGREA